MPITLKGTKDHYTEELTLSGTKFRLLELEDDAFAEFLEAQRELLNYVRAAGKPSAEAEAVFAAAQEGDTEAMQRVTDFVDELPDPAKVVQARKLLVATLDIAVRNGVVGWDIAEECTPANVVLLDRTVKNVLAAKILALTQLSPDERDFFREGGASDRGGAAGPV